MESKYLAEIESIIREEDNQNQDWISNLMEYHKGEFCKHGSNFCQEGNCLNCELGLTFRRIKSVKQTRKS
jgi:hypothetical protein